MAVSQAYIFLWGSGIVFVFLPHLNLGLLSDYKICGDSECESLMSRVQAIRDHHSKDCRFLSFRRGDTIFVYHKLTGKREDLWAGSIDKQFGYFPKEAVEEEQVYATMEKIVETQKSDFFCVDEFGYPIDSSHLDTGDDDDSDQKIPIQESETTQTSPYTDDTNAGSPSTSEDASTESPASAQESDGTSAEENENKNDGDGAAGTHEEAHETPAALNEQGGSPSSSWLSSSVTGWLGLVKEEETGKLAEGEKKDDIKETQAKDSFTSSVTGWLGLGGEGKPDDAKDSINSQEEDKETADSFTSTMTGWLGFGGEKKTEQEHDEEIEMDEEKEPAEKFRSRRLSLDLETDQLQDEEKKEMGTLDWLGNGLSSTLGFGLTNQESEHETTVGRREAEEISQEEEEQPASSSWLDLGITDILGFRKDKNEVEETAISGFKETKEDKTLEQPTESQNVNTSQSQPALTDEAKTEPRLERLQEKVVTKTETVLEAEGDNIISSSNKDTTETQQDQNLPSETETQLGNTASVDADSNGKLEEKSQTVSSMLDSFSQTGSEEEEESKILDDNRNEKNVVDEEKKTEMEGEDHQMPESVGNEDEVNGRESGEETQSASDIDEDFLPQNDIPSGSVFSSDDLKSNSTGHSVSEAEEVKKDQLQGKKTESVNEQEAEITKQIDNTEESTEMSVEIDASGDDHKGEGSKEESAEQSQVSGGAEDSSGGSLPFLSSDTAEENNEPVPSEDVSLTVDHSDTLAITDNNTETETQHGDLGQGGEPQSVKGSSQEFGSSHTTNRSAEIHEHASEEDRGIFSSHESAPNQDTNMDNTDLASVAPQMQKMAIKSEDDADKLKETENNLQPAQAEKETLDFEKDFTKESDRKSEAEAETEEESKKEEKQQEIEELKEGETQGELKEVEEIKEEEKQEKTQELKENEKQEGIEELKEEEKQKKVEDLKENEKQAEIQELKEEEKEKKVEDLKDNEKQVATEELKEEENQEELKKVEEMKEEEKQKEEKELKEQENHEAVDELKIDEKQEEVEELKKREKREAVEQLKEGTTQEEVGGLSDEEKQQEVEEIKEEKKKEEVVEDKLKGDEKKEEVEEKKQDVVKELKEEEKQEVVKELKEEEKQEVVEELKEVEKQEVVEELKEEEKQEVVEELKEVEKQEVVEELKEEEKQEVVEELKEEEKQEVVEELKEEEKQEVVEELKEVEKQEVVEELKEEEKQEVVEELKEEEKQDVVDELKEEEKPVEGLREEEKQQEVEEVKEEKKKEVVEGLKKEEKQELKEEEKQEDLEEVTKGLQSSPQNQNDIGNDKKTQDENDLESVFQSQTESFQAEEVRREGELQKEEKQEAVEEVKEEEKREVEIKQQAKDVEDETRSKEEEESVKCSNESSFQSVQDERHNYEDGSSSAYEGTTQTGQDDNSHILSARTEESEGISFENDKDRIQEEEKRKNEMEEKRNDEAEAGVRGKEQEETKNSEENEHIGSNSANGISDLNFEVDQTGEIEHADNEVPYSSENDHRRPNESLDHLYSGETKHADLCNDVDMKCAGETSTTEKITEQIHSDDHNRGTAEAESGGAFGLLKNAFSFFGETPKTEIKESTEPAPSLDTNTGDMSQPQASLTPEQEPDSTTASSQVFVEDLHPDSPAFAEIQPSSPSQTQTPSHPSALSPNTEAPLKPKTPSEHYKTLLAHMSTDDTTILVELFGRHKLQFLDYILGRSEPVTEDPDDDESILLDIETLLHYHRETLFAPNMKLTDAPPEDKEKTRTLIALQKLEMLLKRVRETFNIGKSDIIQANHQAEASCVGASCSTHSKDQEMTTGDESRKTGDSSVGLDDNIRRDEGTEEEKERDGQLIGGTGKEKETEKRGEMERGGQEERVSPEETGNKVSHNQPGSPQPLEGVMKQILDFVHQIAEDSFTHVRAVRELLIWLTVQVVSSLPDDIRPGPDLYGVPWEPIIISSLVGLVTMLLFSCRCYSSVKSRMYRSKERWMAEQVAQLLDEKCKVLETLSICQQEHDELETSLRDSGVLAHTQKTEHLEVKTRQLEHAKRELERDLDQLKDQLDQQREHRIEQERRIAVLEESMKTCEQETKDLQSQEEQSQTTLKVYSMNSDRLQRNLETAGEENALLQESNAQLRQQVEGWAERVSELEEEMRRCEVAYSGMVQDVANKDERIMSLTDRLLRMKAWDSDLEEERGEEGGEETSNGTAGKGEENGRGDDSQGHLQKVQKLIYAAKLNADLKSVDEDKDRAFAKLNDEVKAKEELEVSIKELENEKLSLQSDSEKYTDQVQRLQQKLNIMTEMYQENELKLHRLLTVEEKERLQKEEKLNKADKNIALAMEELHNYRHRAEEMEEELEKTKQSYQTQISAHEKKAHNNWLAARAADRDLSDIRRENALLRQKLTDTQFKLDALDKDPYALESLARPLPFRAERSPYGPSPLGRPASETRAFLSPPTLMEGPPARLSPRVEPPGGHGEMERSGGPHSDSGSVSPSWERDRRGPPPGPPGPLGHPGYMFPEPGGPMYRRPVPPPGVMGILPPPGSLPLGSPLPHPRGLPPAGPPGRPHPADMADGAYRENSLGPGEHDHRESGPSDRRTPPEADPRMGGAPPPGPPMGPMDGPFPRRAPYGPPPPDFYPPRGPGGPPMMPMWAPPPPGMMFPPRFPPGGPPHPHMPSYGPPMRPPPPGDLPPPSMGPPPPRQPLPSLPHSQSPEERPPSPQDVI